MTDETQKALQSENGEYWFVGLDHEGNEQLYDHTESGPATTNEMYEYIALRAANWLTALACDHFKIPSDGYNSFQTEQTRLKLISDYWELGIKKSDETIPWKVSAHMCIESARAACKLIESGDFEQAMLYVASTIHSAHGATADKAKYDSMRQKSRTGKAAKEKKIQAKADMEVKRQRTRDLLEAIVLNRGNEPLPNKTNTDNHLLENYKKEIPARDELKKTTSKHLKKLGIRLPPHSTATVEIKKTII